MKTQMLDCLIVHRGILEILKGFRYYRQILRPKSCHTSKQDVFP